MKTPVSVCIALLIAASVAAGEEFALSGIRTPTGRPCEFVDDFRDAKLEGRQAERGKWRFHNGIANCVADPVLYRKYKNHGPILKWPREFDDATIEFEMKAEDCQRVVFTLNGDGHIFRVTLADERPNATAGKSKVPTRVIAWATKSSKQNKGDTIKPERMPDLPAVNGRWVRMQLKVEGKRATLTIGDFQTEIEHAALGRDRNMVMLTFAHGELSVRKFRMTSPGKSGAKLSPVDGARLPAVPVPHRVGPGDGRALRDGLAAD
jgi:hypothetical protein